MKLPKSFVAYAGLAALVVAVVLGVLLSHGSSNTSGSHTSGTGNVSSSTHGSVPAAATATLQKIDDGSWPESAHAPGTKGGTTWRNQDGDLPRNASGKSISYLEWDVNPKQQGRTRDAQRIITGSDGSAWYTGDHYKTFTRMR